MWNRNRIERSYQIEKVYASQWDEWTFVGSVGLPKGGERGAGWASSGVRGIRGDQFLESGLNLSNCSDSGVDTKDAGFAWKSLCMGFNETPGAIEDETGGTFRGERGCQRAFPRSVVRDGCDCVHE